MRKRIKLKPEYSTNANVNTFQSLRLSTQYKREGRTIERAGNRTHPKDSQHGGTN